MAQACQRCLRPPFPPSIIPRRLSGTLAFTLRGGVQAQPEYFGAEEFRYGPDIGFSLDYFSFGGREIGSLSGEEALGLSFVPSFRYIPERSAADYAELTGLEDVDAAIELGFGARYRLPNVEIFADLRRGFGGHEAFVGELGADLVVVPTDRLTLRAGPRVLWGDEDYTGTYFGVTGSEAAASGFDAFTPEAGLVSAGVELGVTYQVNDIWGVEGAVRYDRLQGDAADSPLVQDDSQISLRVGITRSVTLDF